MKELEQTAEERLQEKALVNARALLDKIEKGERGPNIWISLVVTALVLGTGFTVFWLMRPAQYREPSQMTSTMTSSQYVDYFLNRTEQLTNQAREQRGKKALEGLYGTVDLRIVVHPDGKTDVALDRLTGDSQVDDGYKRIVKILEPYGRPPRTQEGTPLMMRARLSVKGDPGLRTLVVERLP